MITNRFRPIVCLHARIPPFRRIATSPHRPLAKHNVNRRRRSRITRQCFASGFRRFFYSIFTARQLLYTFRNNKFMYIYIYNDFKKAFYSVRIPLDRKPFHTLGFQ